MILFLARYFNDEIISNTKTHFYTDYFFKLFCIKYDFAKYFAKHRNSFKYFVWHTMTIF